MKNKTSTRIIFKTNSLVIPLSVILTVLIAAITVLTMSVNVTTSDLADLMQRSTEYQQTATNMQAGTSALSESLSGFIQTPVIPAGPEAGTLNTGPLLAYARELAVTDRRPKQILEQFKTFKVTEEALGYIEAAASYADQMMQLQAHALSLILSVYPLSDEPDLKVISTIELTEEERAMPADARIAKAKAMLFDKDYSLLRYYINENVENCHKAINDQFDLESVKSKQTISTLRSVLWSIIIIMSVVLAVTFVLFYIWIIIPLRQYSKDMAADKPLLHQEHTKELWTMVNAYNALLQRRDRLDAILRAAAGTDTLTGLPNRYSLEQSLLDLSKAGGSLTVLIFDINFLKKVNDTQGHPEGDKLIRKSADIILECFGTKDRDNCYRIGGDEFAVILRGCTDDEIKLRADKFVLAQEREEISVSFGYATDGNADADTFHRLAKLADVRLYEQKKQMHAIDTD